MEPRWRQVNLVCSAVNGHIDVLEQPMTPMREDLLALFDRSELAKYFTEEELPAEPDVAAQPEGASHSEGTAQPEGAARPEGAAQPEVTVP
jgi:succinate dehydrogenase / fumarate reductase flavoprotein subunit